MDSRPLDENGLAVRNVSPTPMPSVHWQIELKQDSFVVFKSGPTVFRTHAGFWQTGRFREDPLQCVAGIFFRFWLRWSSGFDGRIVDWKNAGRRYDLRVRQGVGCRSVHFQNDMTPVVYITFAGILVNQNPWLISIRILQIDIHAARGCGRIRDHRMHHCLHGVATCRCRRSY